MLGRPSLLDPLIQRQTAAVGELLRGEGPELAPPAHLAVEGLSSAFRLRVKSRERQRPFSRHRVL